MFERIRRAVLFLVGFTIPIQAFALGGGTLRATPFKLVVVLLFMVAGAEFARRAGGRPRDSKTFWVIAFAASFLVSFAMSTIAGLPYQLLLGSGTTMAALATFYFLLSYSVRDRTDLRIVLWGVVLGGAITLVPAARVVREGLSTAGERFEGLAGQSNVLGADMAVCFALALGLFFTTRARSAKILLMGAGAISLAGVAISLSRSAFVSLGVMWVFWMVRAGRRNVIQYTIPALLLTIVAILAAPTAVQERFGTIVDARQRQADFSIQSRFHQNWVALKAFASNPVVGVGAERFRYWALENREGRLGSIHNAYLYIAAEQGLFGLVPFLALLLLTWRDYSRCWRISRSHRLIRDRPLMELGELALYLQIALISTMVAGLFHQQHRSKALWTIIALSPIVVALVNARVAEIRGTRPDPEFEPAPDFPRLGGGRLAEEPLPR